MYNQEVISIVRDQVYAQVATKTSDQIEYRVWWKVLHQVRNPVDIQIWTNVCFPISNQLIEKYEYS
jgi:hypothetical protein